MQNRCNLHAHLLTILLVFAFLISACGGSGSVPTALDESIPGKSDTAMEASGEQGEPAGEDMDVDISGMVNQELPPGFPAEFPIPPDAQVTSTISLGADDEFRVYFSMIDSLEQTIAFFDAELPLAGWTIVEQMESPSGYEFEIENPTYGGNILLVGAETGVALDVHLFPVGIGETIPDGAEDLGDSTNLGDSGSSFPSDLPLPTSFTPIELSNNLKTESYELAFTYEGIAEMAMVELNIALMTAGWEMGEPTLEGISGEYILPFTEPGSGFEGYAYITSNPGQFNMDAGGAVLIALAPGQP